MKSNNERMCIYPLEVLLHHIFVFAIIRIFTVAENLWIFGLEEIREIRASIAMTLSIIKWNQSLRGNQSSELSVALQ